jgi:hypothetical protein
MQDRITDGRQSRPKNGQAKGSSARPGRPGSKGTESALKEEDKTVRRSPGRAAAERHTDAGPTPPARRAGRPLGATALRAPVRRRIVGLVRAGFLVPTAARVAGINSRTFRDLRQRAEGRHPTRPPTRELEAFFAELDEANAEAQGRLELATSKRNPERWLRANARTGFDPDSPWADPPATATADPQVPVPAEPPAPMVHGTASEEDVATVLDILIETGAMDHLFEVVEETECHDEAGDG